MEGEKRREEIVKLLQGSKKPVSGTEVARHFGVSRQVIVQDIALLRAVNKNILSTNKGYIIYDPAQDEKKAKRSFYVCHNDDKEMQEELCAVVDLGGKVLDVVVDHSVYGQITVDLFVKNRQDVTEFMEKIRSCTDQPLNVLTGGNHYHTVEADSEEILDKIGEELKKRGFL